MAVGRVVGVATKCTLELERAKRSGGMLMQKQELIEWLVKNGDETTAFDIEGSQFPEEVDTEKNRELLAQHGIDVGSLLGTGDPGPESRPDD
jgi:hypothetical protein